MISRRSLLGGALAAALVPRLARAEKPVVLILSSDESPRTTTIMETFKAKIEGTTRISYQLGGEADAAAFLADNIRDLRIDVVFALGDRAFAAAAREFTTTPVVYADVLDTSPAEGRTNVVGLPLRVEPGQVISRMKTLLPQLRTLGAVRSARDREDRWWTRLEEGCAAQGLKLAVQRASATGDLTNAIQVLLADAQLLWLLPDPGLWTPAAVSRALKDAQLQKRPVIGFDRSWLSAANPAPIVVESSAAGLGEAAARPVLSAVGLKTGDALSEFPAPWLLGGRAAFRALGINLKRETAELIDEWVA